MNSQGGEEVLATSEAAQGFSDSWEPGMNPGAYKLCHPLCKGGRIVSL